MDGVEKRRFEFRESLGLLGQATKTVFTDLLFNAFSSNGNNKVTFEDYIRGLLILKLGTPEERLVGLFVVGDV